MKEEWFWKGCWKRVSFYNRGGWHCISFHYFIGIPIGFTLANGTRLDEFNETPKG